MIEYDYSGVYVVYVGKLLESKVCYMRDIIYIGESKNVTERLNNKHEKYQEWKNCLKKDEELFFSVTKVKSDERELIEAALIFHLKPRCNDIGKESFKYYETMIETFENNELIDAKFTVFPTG